jgi:hypothetical protein
MKKLIPVFLFLFLANATKAQFNTQTTIDATYWCIESLTNATDSVGSYMTVSLSNNDPALFDSINSGYYQNYIQITAIIANNTMVPMYDTITFSNLSNPGFININNDTTVTFRINTVFDFSTIAGFVIQQGIASCGIYWLEPSIIINRSCGVNNLIDPNLLLSFNGIVEASEVSILYPNPSNGMVWFNATEMAINTLQIISIDGKTIVHESSKVDDGIDLRHLPRGTYFAVINGNLSQKIVLY